MSAATLTALGGTATVVLAILGLVGVLPESMVPIATIVFGATLLFEAAAVSARHNAIAHGPSGGASVGARVPARGGVSAQELAGLAGIALGILALLRFAPLTLSTVALIIFGGALLIENESKARFASAGAGGYGPAGEFRPIHESVVGSSGGEVLVGIGAAVLGVLALLGFQGTAPITLVLIGFLALGSALFFSGSALGRHASIIFHHQHAGHQA